jgi:hypothetical protein
VADGLLYSYGCDIHVYQKECRLGRAPLAQALERYAWEFYTGKEGQWSPDVGAAASIMAGNDVMSVAYNAYLGAYLALYATPANQVMLRSAPRPEGPWSQEVLAMDVSHPPPAKYWVYDAVAHPEFELHGGRTQYVTYSRMTSTFTSEMHLVEVVLERNAGGGTMAAAKLVAP